MEFSNSINILNLLNEENYSDLQSNCALIAQGLKSGEFSVVDLIERLKYLLVNPLPLKRKYGIIILTDVLKILPCDFLNVHQLKIISHFYIDKLSDHHEVLPAVLKGILTIIDFTKFPADDVPLMLNGLFHNIACQQQQQVDRYSIYSIFHRSLEGHKKEVLSMGIDFVYGVISSIDGERDPRNLLFLFKWLKIFLATVSLSHLVEEMFEVMACYFPVDFRAPSVDLNGVTRETLAEVLCGCLCAIQDFGKHCIPLALEKLDSSSQIAKTDSLTLLREGCASFDVSIYIKYSSEIWSQIQKEVFSGGNEIVKIEFLETLTVVTNKMSQTEGGHFKSILKDIFSTLKGNILPECKLFVSSVDILYYIAVASQESATYMLKEIIPLLINTFSITIDPVKKALILKSLIKFVTAYLYQYNEVDLKDNEELITVYILCLEASTDMDCNLRAAGFDCLSDVAKSLPLDFRIRLYKNLQKMLIEPQEETVKMSMIHCFKKFSAIYQVEINEHVLYHTKISDPISLDLYFKALNTVANLIYFKEFVTNSLLDYVTENVQFTIIAVKSIKSLLENDSSNTDILEIFVRKDTISKLVKYAVAQTAVDINSRLELLLYISSVLKILIGTQNYEIQYNIIQWQLNVIDSCKEQYQEDYIFLLDGLVSRIRKGLTYNHNVVDILLKNALTNKNDLVKEVAMQLLANLINKQPEDDELNAYLDVIKDNCLQYYKSYKTNVISIMSWITKALIMRNHSLGNVWTELLLHRLEQDCEVAKGFRIIMNDNYESLSSLSYCNKMLLYQQKFFVFTTNKLCADYEPEKLAYLIAIGYLIEYTPQQIILLQFKKIFNLVIRCLEQCNDDVLLCVILKTLRSFILNKESVIQEHLEDLLSRILKLSTYIHSMNVRIAALQCLIDFTSLPLYRILPYKMSVLHELQFCVDDNKRLVRKHAMEARSLWFLIDAPI